MIAFLITTAVMAYVSCAGVCARHWWRLWRMSCAAKGTLHKSKYSAIAGGEVGWTGRSNFAIITAILVALVAWWLVQAVRSIWWFMLRNPPLTEKEAEEIREQELRKLREMEDEAGVTHLDD